jgi:hypothetical protein
MFQSPANRLEQLEYGLLIARRDSSFRSKISVELENGFFVFHAAVCGINCVRPSVRGEPDVLHYSFQAHTV